MTSEELVSLFFYLTARACQYSFLSLSSGRQLFDCIDKGVKTITCSLDALSAYN